MELNEEVQHLLIGISENMKRNVLLISPRINDLYQDIISQLNCWKMNVDFIEDIPDRYNPDFIRSERHVFLDNWVGRNFYDGMLKKRWTKILSQDKYSRKYDYLLVVDGMNVHHYLFEELRRRNPNIWIANYLYDSTKSLFRFHKKFIYYNRVASFDLRDCKEYGLSFLPIYWCEPEEKSKTDYDLFCFGTYGISRYMLFTEIERIASKIGLKSFIKLYYVKIENFRRYLWNRRLRKVLGLKEHINPMHYNSDIITHNSISSKDFRDLIYSSKITVDSVNFNQDGMTARFMWALGAGRKIVTTNANILNYDCYDSNQVFVVKDLEGLKNNQDFARFLQEDYVMSKEQKMKLLPWRLDNWLSYLLNFKTDIII